MKLSIFNAHCTISTRSHFLTNSTTLITNLVFVFTKEEEKAYHFLSVQCNSSCQAGLHLVGDSFTCVLPTAFAIGFIKASILKLKVYRFVAILGPQW
jgi:hypothetical protein